MGQANMEAAERIKAARSKALRLMRMDSEMDAIVNGNRDKINESIEGASVNLQAAPQQPKQQVKNTTPLRNGGQMSAAAANMPREIVESFKNNVIDDSQLLTQVLAGTNDISMLTEGMPQRQQPSSTMPREITEAYGTPQQQQQMNVVQPQVDYPMIRMIVEEVVKKYASALQKKVLSESASRGNEVGALMLGKTLRLVDKQGNVYEAVLKKVSNLNENKK